MVMQAMHSGRGSKVLKYFFFFLLVMATIGLVLTDVGGFFRGGVSLNDVAKVDGEKISITSFDRNARRALARMNMTQEQAYQMGYMDNLLSSQVRSTLFQHIAEDNGIKVSRPLIAEQISTLIKSQAGIENDQQAVFDQLLRNQGYTEPEFVKTLSAEISAGILGRAVQNKYIGVSDNLARDLYQITYETRSLDIIPFLNKDAKQPEAPTEAQIAQLYDSMKENFAIAESRIITVGLIDDSSIKDSIEASDDVIRGLYEDNIDMYSIPEERVMEQVVLTTQSEAQAALDKAKAGSSMKEVAGSATYIEPQAYREDGLPPEISELVFGSVEASTYYGPIESPLGWHVLKVNEVKPAYVQKFEDVKNQITKNYLDEESADQKYTLAAEIDDMLAGGATPQDVAREVKLQITRIEDVTALGAMASQYHALDQFGESATDVTQAALQYGEGESSPVSELKDGRMYFIHIDKVTPKSYKPLEEVRADLEKMWIRDQQIQNNKEAVQKIVQEALTEERELKDIARTNNKTIQSVNGISKNEEPPAPLANAALQSIFSGNQGDVFMIEIEGGFAIARINSITLPEIGEDEPEGLTAIKDTLRNDASEESLSIYFEGKRQEYDVKINEDILKRVYGGQQQQSL
jgi:peptidyl-prolyl cis-trans isomerase D